jgi:hypothetical protein
VLTAIEADAVPHSTVGGRSVVLPDVRSVVRLAVLGSRPGGRASSSCAEDDVDMYVDADIVVALSATEAAVAT